MAGRYGLTIRAAEAADAQGLAELLASAGLPTAPADLALRLEAIRREGGVVLLAQEWGPPSGAMALHWLQPLHGPRSAQASLLLVAADARRRGVGRLLLKAGAQAARAAGCDALQLAAPAEAEALQAFCRDTGFLPAGDLWTRPLRKRS